jgi:CheY-like chemotaxis protein
MDAPRPPAGFTVVDERPIVLLVAAGSGPGLLENELERNGLRVVLADAGSAAERAEQIAPDLVVLAGAGSPDQSDALIERLQLNPRTGIVPIVLLGSAGQSEPLCGFRHGVVSVIPRDLGTERIALRIAGIARELPERPGTCRGEVEEATLDQLVEVLSKELRSGILSVRGRDAEGEGQSARIVLRSGKPISEPMDSFVERVKPALAGNRRASFEFEETAAGRLDSIAPPAPDEGDERQMLRGRRVLVACSKAERAQSLAAQLRDHGALVVAACGADSELDRARALDPEVVVISAADMEGSCSRLVEELRADLRLRWASLLVIPQEQLGPEGAEQELVAPLAGKIALLAAADQDLRQRARLSSRFETRLEIVGPGRTLRALAESGKTLRLSVIHPRVSIDVDLGDGLVLGAAGQRKSDREKSLTGTAALAALLALASGRVRVEERTSSDLSELIAPVDLTLAMAASEVLPIKRSLIPKPMIERV